MRAVERLRKSLHPCLESVHATRLAAVFAVVSASFSASHAGLTALGRALSGTPKHGIKRVDRLLGNRHMHRELPLFYRALARFALRGVRQPVVLVDWTAITEELYCLVAAVSADGRSFPLYCEVHPRGQDGNPRVEIAFLDALHSILPKDCVPIVVTDAGFRTAWMKRIHSFGWHFIVRLRGAMCVQTPSGQWVSGAGLREMATKKARRIDACVAAKSSPTPVSVVLWDGRSRRARSSKSKARQASAETNARRAREPWVLATSLRSPAKQLVRLYKQRMQIEEMFRDAKCGRFGFGLRMTLSTRPNRVAVLVLLTCLALAAALLVGIAGYRKKLNRAFQANTRRQRVLGLVRLGYLLIRQRHPQASFAPYDVRLLRERASP